MRIVEIETQDHQRRYVVIDDEGALVEPIVRYLQYLDRIGAARKPHTYPNAEGRATWQQRKCT